MNWKVRHLDRPSDPVPPPKVSHASRGVAGFDGRSAPESVYEAIWRALEDEAERQELEAEAAG